MNKIRITFLVIAGILMLSAFVGCTEGKGETGSASETEQADRTEGSEEKPIDLEIWTNNNGTAIEKDSPMYNLLLEALGVGVIQPYVEWNGGQGYLDALNLRLAAGAAPDIFMPWENNETAIIKNGGVTDLTDLLSKYCPNVWYRIPQEVWDIVRMNDPTGKGCIYGVPMLRSYGKAAGMIRMDWLDKLGLEMPRTQDELVSVLRAFKDKDPNGNGVKDEIPTSGRQEARWMDYLFAMYGVAIFEGYPMWDLYDGELTYSAVTPNMKEALRFISMLYQEELLDPETLLNSTGAWTSKIQANQVGVFFHFVDRMDTWAGTIYDRQGIKPDWAVLPPVEVSGYEGFYTMREYSGLMFLVRKQADEKRLMACLQYLNNVYDPKNYETLYWGVEGMHHEVKGGIRVMLPVDPEKQQTTVVKPWEVLADLQSVIDIIDLNTDPDAQWVNNMSKRNILESLKYSKVIAGEGIPDVYDDETDIKNRALYKEYISKIIIGQYPIDKFDEFVEKWYSSGGDMVTKRAREWYEKAKKK